MADEFRMILSMHETYASIALSSYKQYLDIEKQKVKLKEEYDALDKSNYEGKREMERTAYENKTQQRNLSYIAVLFECFAIESFINDYSFKLLSSSMCEHLDRLDIISKIVVSYRLIKKEEFPVDKNVYRRLKDLVSLRNNLVHSKSVVIKANDRFADKLPHLYGNKKKMIDDLIGQVIGTYQELREIME